MNLLLKEEVDFLKKKIYHEDNMTCWSNLLVKNHVHGPCISDSSESHYVTFHLLLR